MISFDYTISSASTNAEVPLINDETAASGRYPSTDALNLSPSMRDPVNIDLLTSEDKNVLTEFLEGKTRPAIFISGAICRTPIDQTKPSNNLEKAAKEQTKDRLNRVASRLRKYIPILKDGCIPEEMLKHNPLYSNVFDFRNTFSFELTSSIANEILDSNQPSMEFNIDTIPVNERKRKAPD